MRVHFLLFKLFISCCVICGACKMISFKPKPLWEIPAKTAPKNINGVYALNILSEGIGSDVWFTKNATCLQIKTSDSIFLSGKKSLHIVWDKQAGGCPWLGLGIGWDGWSSKNLSSILDSAAIQIRVFSKSGKIKSLPLAAGLEDYYGNQAWTGMGADKLSYQNGENWARVILPLNTFNWKEQQCDPSNLKQFIIQFEAAGEIYFDEIEIVKMQ